MTADAADAAGTGAAPFSPSGETISLNLISLSPVPGSAAAPAASVLTGGAAAEPDWTQPVQVSGTIGADLVTAVGLPEFYLVVTAAMVDAELANAYPWRGVLGDSAAAWLAAAWSAGLLGVNSGVVVPSS